MAKSRSDQIHPTGAWLSWWVFGLSFVVGTMAIYLRHDELVSAWIQSISAGEPPPDIKDPKVVTLLNEMPLTLILLAIGFILTGFTRSLVTYTQNAWSLIGGSLEDYREGLHQGILRFQGEAIRLIKYNDADGMLINTTAHDEKSSPRNVLLNNLTIQRILWGIRSKSESDLEAVGMQCGSGFGSVVLRLNDSDRDDFRALMFAWFKYDSNAGFGRFELVESKRGIQIALRHNFLTAGDEFRTAPRSLCAFMRGYIKGVMMEMPHSALTEARLDPRRLTVRHDPTTQDCICSSGKESRGCIFTVTTEDAAI